jgi:hypothetical protein
VGDRHKLPNKPDGLIYFIPRSPILGRRPITPRDRRVAHGVSFTSPRGAEATRRPTRWNEGCSDFEERFGTFVHLAAATGTPRREVGGVRGTAIERNESIIPMAVSTVAAKGGAKVLLVSEIPLPDLFVAQARLCGSDPPSGFPSTSGRRPS